MLKGNEELERIVAKHHQLRVGATDEFERVLIVHHRLRRERNVQRSFGDQIRPWLQARLRFAESHVFSLLLGILTWCATRLLWFALLRLSTGRLSKRRARSLSRVVKQLNRASVAILHWRLRRQIQKLG